MKKKILFLSDDLRMTSGISTMSKEIVMGTVDKFDWIQLGAAIRHPELGKIIDMNEDIRNRTGVQDANVKIIPCNGYGDIHILRKIIQEEKPDAILHFTDPHYWSGYMMLNMKLGNRFLSYIITYGIIFPTQLIIKITMKVVIG